MRILQSLLWFSRNWGWPPIVDTLGASELLSAVQHVFMTARTFGLPLIYIRAQYTCEGSPWVLSFEDLKYEKPAHEVTIDGVTFAQEQPGEIEMPKTTYDAFANT